MQIALFYEAEIVLEAAPPMASALVHDGTAV